MGDELTLILYYVCFSTDSKIQQTIRECFSQCTIITIAHRLHTVMNSDRIMVLSDGRLVVSAYAYYIDMWITEQIIVIVFYDTS